MIADCRLTVGAEPGSTYRYRIPLGGTWRSSSLVVGDLGGEPVTGIVNDLDLGTGGTP